MSTLFKEVLHQLNIYTNGQLRSLSLDTQTFQKGVYFASMKNMKLLATPTKKSC